MSNFERLSVLVIAVIIVMIVVVAIHTWTSDPTSPDAAQMAGSGGSAPAGMSLSEPRDAGASADWAPQAPAEPRPLEPIQVPETVSGEDIRAVVLPADEAAGSTKLVFPAEGFEIDASSSPAEDTGADAAMEENAPPAAPWEYEIKADETLGHIAQRELGSYVRYREILELNPGIDPSNLRPGQKVTMPSRIGSSRKSSAGAGERDASSSSSPGSAKPGGTWVVRRGDTLKTIAKRVYNDSGRWHYIYAANIDKIPTLSDLTEGVELALPTR